MKTTTRHLTDASTDRLDKVVHRAASLDLRRRVVEVLKKIESDCYLEETIREHESAIASGASYWDMCCALAAFAELHSPQCYLEIGVRRGRSASIVAAFQPDVSLCLFDMWHPDYAGVPNPGPEFVRAQLRHVGHHGTVHFVDGRSQEMIPRYFQSPECPERFELMTVDGDHRDVGARADLDNVVERLAPGGLLVFDDISHPTYPTLAHTWRGFIVDHPELTAIENPRNATGTALALRIR